MNCKKCKRSNPLNLVCFDQKCGLQQNLNLICCMCHSSYLIHQTVSLNMFLDIAQMATQGWVNSKEDTLDLMDEIDKLILQLQDKKIKLNQYLQYYDKNTQKYNKLMSLIGEFKRQVHYSEIDDEELFEDTYREIKNHFNFTPNNPSQPIKLMTEQSYDNIKISIQELLDEFSKQNLQVLQIKDHNLRQLKQQQISQNQQFSYNGNIQSNGNRNGSNYQQKNNSQKNNSYQNSLYKNNTQQNIIQQNNSNSSTFQQNKKQSNNQNGSMQSQNQNLYEPKEMLDYDELFSRNCIDIGFKVLPKYVEERKNIEKSQEQNKNLSTKDENNSNKKNDTSNIKNELNSIKVDLNNSQAFNQKYPKMEIEQVATLIKDIIDEKIKKEYQNENSMEIEHLENNNNHQNKNKMMEDADDKMKRDSIQFFDINMQQISSLFPKNNQQTINSIQSQQQQSLIKQGEKKIQTRSSSSAINITPSSQPTSLTNIPQSQVNPSPDKQKPSSKNEISDNTNTKNTSRKIDSATNPSQTNKQNQDADRTIKSENSIKSEQLIKQDQQKSEIMERGESQTKLEKGDKESKGGTKQVAQEKRHQVNSSRRFRLNEEDEDLSSKNQKSGSGDEDDEDGDNQRNNCPSGKKPKYIKKYDRKGQDYLKVLTEEQIDELIVDYNNLKNWREVEKKWGISKYHIIKYFKEQRYIINNGEDGEGDTQ